METNDDTAGRRVERREWIGRGPRWPAREARAEIRVWPEWWSFEWETFDGSWILEECAEETDEDALACGLARVLLARIAAHAVRRDTRGEDLCDDLTATSEYLEQLALPPHELNPGRRLLAALVPFDAEAIAEALLSLAWNARAEGLDRTARSLAQLAYEAAASHLRFGMAQGSALALAHLAWLQECPRVARKWQRVAYLHGRRVVRVRSGAEFRV